MNGAALEHRSMIEAVARALGDELLGQMAFLGGCTTGLPVTDETARDSVRHTDDVDLIVGAVTHGDWYRLQTELMERGFRRDPQDGVVCPMRLGRRIVDFMPPPRKESWASPTAGTRSRWKLLSPTD
jgi:hypothetical protein